MKTLRKTKIICTIGPSSESEEKLSKLIDEGMNVARLNCSHGDNKQRQTIVDKLKKIRVEKNKPLAILLDTKGPEVRIKSFKDGAVHLLDGSKFTLTTKDVEGTSKIVSVTYKDLIHDLKAGDTILANDGLVKMKVDKINGEEIICKIIVGGELSNNKSLNFPGKDLSLEFLSDNDKEDLLFATKNNLDYIACSFVSNENDIIKVREFLDKNNGQDIRLIAKIENQSGIDNLKNICNYCEGIMVARGDLGVEIDFDKLPSVQKKIINECSALRKIAITSTEMLESMINNPRPTRAEVSDVANAIYDGTTAVMLSGETASGKYPIESLQTMSKIAKTTENTIDYRNLSFNRLPQKTNKTPEAIAHATCAIAADTDTKGILNITDTGFTSEKISQYRPHVDVVTITLKESEYNKLALYWGINPVVYDYSTLNRVGIQKIARKYVKEILGLKSGEKYVINSGYELSDIGYISSIHVENLP